VAILGSALLLLVAAPVGAATTHPAAHAKAAITLPNSCTRIGTVVCIYASSGFSGGPGHFTGTNADFGADFGSSNGACVAGSTAASDNKGGWNDCVSSIVNNTKNQFFFFVDTHCGTTTSLDVGAESDISNLGANLQGQGTGHYNDSISSDQAGTSDPGC